MSFYKREDPDPEDWTPHHSDHKVRTCRQCGEVLLRHGQKQFNGWFWCDKHYAEITALHMGQPVPVTEAEAADHFEQRRRN